MATDITLAQKFMELEYYEVHKNGNLTHKIKHNKNARKFEITTIGFLWDSKKMYNYDTVPDRFKHLRLDNFKKGLVKS